MWILDFLPSWFFTLITALSIGAVLVTEFINGIPFIDQYSKLIRIVGIIGLAFGLYMMGGSANQERWEARVKELEVKVAISEEQSKTANAELAASIKENKNLVKQQQIIVQEKITKVAEKINAECKVPAEAIELLNQAAEQPK